MYWSNLGGPWEKDFRELNGVLNYNPTAADYAKLYARIAQDCPGCKIDNTSGNMIREVVQVRDTVYIR